MTFSQDEINLMCIYDTSDKTELFKRAPFFLFRTLKIRN